VLATLAQMTSGNGLDAPTLGALVVSVDGVDAAPNFISGESPFILGAVVLGVLPHVGLLDKINKFR
jgi:hypothetical protein